MDRVEKWEKAVSEEIQKLYSLGRKTAETTATAFIKHETRFANLEKRVEVLEKRMGNYNLVDRGSKNESK